MSGDLRKDVEKKYISVLNSSIKIANQLQLVYQKSDGNSKFLVRESLKDDNAVYKHFGLKAIEAESLNFGDNISQGSYSEWLLNLWGRKIFNALSIFTRGLKGAVGLHPEVVKNNENLESMIGLLEAKCEILEGDFKPHQLRGDNPGKSLEERGDVTNFHITYLDPELFSALYLYSKLKRELTTPRKKELEKLVKIIAAEVSLYTCEGKEKSDHIIDDSTLWWGLKTLIEESKNGTPIKFGKKTIKVDDLIAACSLLMDKKFGQGLRYPKQDEVMTEATPEIYGERRTCALIVKNCTHILEYIPENSSQHRRMEEFLSTHIGWVCQHSAFYLNHLYFRGLFLEALRPYLKRLLNDTEVSDASKKPEPQKKKKQKRAKKKKNCNYSAIVEFCWEYRNSMETNLRTESKKTEPGLRDSILSHLQQKRLNVTAESQHGHGRTDIMIQNDGKVIFIAECKVCGPVKKFDEAVDGLFEKYLKHNQNKATIILFVTQKNYTAFLGKLTTHIKQCSTEGTFVEAAKGRYVLEMKKDGHNVCFTTLCFHVPKKKKTVSKHSSHSVRRK